MNDGLKKLTDRFTNFFTRSVAPSSIFFVLLYFNDRFFNHGCWFEKFLCFLEDVKSIHDVFLYICLVLLFLAYGYINQMFSQLFDDFIKDNYTSNNSELCKLREKVKLNLQQKEKSIFEVVKFNDYNAYQVLGKGLNVGDSYVDNVKSIHTFAIASIFNIVLYMLLEKSLSIVVLCAFLLSAIICVSHMLAKSRYKARNKRLYINYLLKEDKKDKYEKEIKIKSIKVEVDE